MLRVSVIIPTYNRANYLPLALQSIFSQRLKPYEIIVVDDGSSDGTVDLVKGYGAQVRYVSQPNQGVAAARNHGLALAQGEVIAWLDADDLWEPNFLFVLVSLLEANPEIDGAYAGFAHIDAAGNQLTIPSFKAVPPADLYRALIDSDLIVTSAFVVRKRCFEKVGYFDEQFRICEDWDLFLRLAKVCTLVGVPETLMRLRVHETNLTRDTQALCRSLLALTRKHFGSSEEGEPPAWSEDKRRAYARAYFDCAWLHLQAHAPEEGWRYFGMAARTWPALLNRLDAFYELVCGDQPRSHRGRADRLDIEANGAELLTRLDALFATADVSLCDMRRQAYSNAYLALGLLSDQAGHWSAARRYLFLAVAANPGLLTSLSITRRILKLCFGQRLVQLARRLLHRAPPSDLPRDPHTRR